MHLYIATLTLHTTQAFNEKKNYYIIIMYVYYIFINLYLCSRTFGYFIASIDIIRKAIIYSCDFIIHFTLALTFRYKLPIQFTSSSYHTSMVHKDHQDYVCDLIPGSSNTTFRPKISQSFISIYIKNFNIDFYFYFMYLNLQPLPQYDSVV